MYLLCVFSNPSARGQLKKEKCMFPCPRSCLSIWSRETGLAVPSRDSLLILHTQAESCPYSLYSSRFPRRRPQLTSAAIVSARNSSSHVIAYRCRSLRRVYRHRASSPQCSFSNNGCCLFWFHHDPLFLFAFLFPRPLLACFNSGYVWYSTESI